jgi:hypothetical protein
MRRAAETPALVVIVTRVLTERCRLTALRPVALNRSVIVRCLPGAIV